MEPNVDRKRITDALWQILEPALLEAKHSRAGAPAAISDRDFLEAMLYLNRTGCPWRDLPAEFGPWHTIYERFRRWEKRNVWQQLWERLRQAHCGAAWALFIDSTVVRAHQHAAGARKTADSDQALGRSRGGLSTKIHVATIDENCSVAITLSPGQDHDAPHFEPLYQSLPQAQSIDYASLDKAYDADAIRARLTTAGVTPVIPPKANRKEPVAFDAERYKERNRVERFFNKLKQFRRIATRYDKLRRTFAAAVHLVAAYFIAKNS